MIQNKSHLYDVMKDAWALFHLSKGEISFSESLQTAWKTKKISYVHYKLKRDDVEFWFVKKSNKQLRRAVGTKRVQYIPKDAIPKGVKEVPRNIETFWDIEKCAWRSFDKNTIVKVTFKD